MSEFLIRLPLYMVGGYVAGAAIGALLAGDVVLPRVPIIGPMFQWLCARMQWIFDVTAWCITRLAHPKLSRRA